MVSSSFGRWAVSSGIVVLAVVLNGALSLVGEGLKLPIFLDSTFTVVVAALFGLWPGVLVGAFSNLFFEVIKGFPGHLWQFGLVNMATALITALMVKFGCLKTMGGVFWLLLTLALANSLLGAFLVTVLFGGTTNEPVDSIVRSLLITGQSIFSSAFLGRIFINVVDKGIAVLVMLTLYLWYQRRPWFTTRRA